MSIIDLLGNLWLPQTTGKQFGRPTIAMVLCSIAALGSVSFLAAYQQELPDQYHIQDRKMAVVIGNNSYAYPLHNAVNDAIAVADVLQAEGFTVTFATDLNNRTLAATLQRFLSSLQKGDVVVFYYSGHGMQIDGENYLVPIDFEATSASQARFSAFPLSKALDAMEGRGTRLNIVILDACRNNPFGDSKGGLGGLAVVTSGEGTFLSFAAAPGKTASDNIGGNHGLFTKALIENFHQPGLDIDALFNRVRKQVARESNGQQIPWVSSSILYSPILTHGLPGSNSPLPISPAEFQGLTASKLADLTSMNYPLIADRVGSAQEVSRPTRYAQNPEPHPQSPIGVSSSSDPTMRQTYPAGLPPKAGPLAPTGQIGPTRNGGDYRELEAQITSLGDAAETLILRAQLSILRHRYADSLIMLNAALTKFPLDGTPLYLRSLVYGLEGKYQLALQDCAAGRKYRSSDTRFLLSEANIFYVTGRYRQATATIGEILARDPTQAVAYVIRGNCERALGDFKAAENDFNSAAELQAH